MNSSSNVLIVDDNPFNREFLRAVLELEGLIVFEAESGKDALKQIELNVFSIIFMDILMPGMDGFETTRKIRSKGIKTPIVAVSAMSFKQDRQRSLEAGCDDFLPKPIDTSVLKAILSRFLTEEAIPVDDDAVKEVTHAENIDLSRFHILLVEENDVTAFKYAEMLRTRGFQVSKVKNGELAWLMLTGKEKRYDIVISNIFTSQIDALGLLTMVKREFPHILVFIYTPKYDADTFHLAMQQGVNGIIPQMQFESSAAGFIEPVLIKYHQKGSRSQDAATAYQVRKAQEQLIRFGCNKECSIYDVAYSTLHEAGGDMARCKMFEDTGNCGFVLADVAGHDVMSSYISAMFLGMLASNWDKYPEPIELIRVINRELYKLGYENSHVCASVVNWDKYNHKLKIATAGNPGALLLTMSEKGKIKIRELKGGGLCLGLLTEDFLFLNEEVDIDEKTFFFLFSDGIEKRHLIKTIMKFDGLFGKNNISGLCQMILDKIISQNGQDDDMILLCLLVDGKKRLLEKHYRIDSNYRGIDEACLWLEKELDDVFLSSFTDKDLILLSARETLLNAVEHGNAKSGNASVYLSINGYPERMIISVTDSGDGFDLAAKLGEINRLDGFQIGKRGLNLMKSISDEIMIQGGTVSLVFNKKQSDDMH